MSVSFFEIIRMFFIFASTSFISVYFYVSLKKTYPVKSDIKKLSFVAGSLAGLVYGIIYAFISSSKGDELTFNNFKFFVNPVIIEIMKFIVLFVIIKKVKRINPFDGFVIGGIFGAGYGLVENMFFGYDYISNIGSEESNVVFILRGFAVLFTHSFYSALVGSGIGTNHILRKYPVFINVFPAIIFNSTFTITTTYINYWGVSVFFLCIVLYYLFDEISQLKAQDRLATSIGYYDDDGNYFITLDDMRIRSPLSVRTD
ncbi:MAG: PrsW family intramembrane metalloprotease [Candidatus Heimdallarchaeota archaeon]|nr:PrsW family intramembrane metalloprotease [Candidatus Heimdallarchaeota archaeon]